MKLKGINPIEKNVEKIVLGVVFLVLLAALAMQFLVKPNEVDVGGGRSVPPENINIELANEASRLQGQIQDRSPSLPEVKPTDLLERYETALSTSATGVGQVPPLAEGVDVLSGVQVGDGAIASGGPVMAPRVPAPTSPVASSQWGTLDPYAVEASEALARLAPQQQPYDVPAVSVEAAFSGAELGRLLASAEEGRRPIPGQLRRRVEIVRVELERQQLDRVTGEWADADTGTPLPTAYDPVGELELSQVDLSTLLGAAGDARQNRAEVIQPGFAPLIAGPVWAPPSDAIEAAAAMSDVNSLPRLRQDLARAEDTLADLEERKQNTSGRTTNQPANRPAPNDPRTGAGGRGGAQTPSRPGQSGSTQSLDRRISETRDEVNELRERVRELESEEQQTRREERDALSRPLFEQESMRLWAHDFGVEPGATYRYRVRAIVNNPLYKKGAQLDPDDAEQQSLARDPLVYGDWSSWTSPVTVGAETYYFVTSASTEGQVGSTGPSASVEVFHMYYGHYRADSTRLEPGDSVDVAVTMPDGFVTFDTDTIDEQGMRRYIQELDRGAGEPTEGVTRLATERALSLPAFLLDVSTLPITREVALGGSAGQVLQAVFRDADGSIRTYRPAEATDNEQFRMARASAEAGEVLDLRVPDAQPDRGPMRGPRPPTPGDPRGDPRRPLGP